jgi:hypothetical protein
VILLPSAGHPIAVFPPHRMRYDDRQQGGSGIMRALRVMILALATTVAGLAAAPATGHADGYWRGHGYGRGHYGPPPRYYGPRYYAPPPPVYYRPPPVYYAPPPAYYAPPPRYYAPPPAGFGIYLR